MATYLPRHAAATHLVSKYLDYALCANRGYIYTMNTSFNFSGKVALVTSGVSGIGAAASLSFERSGATVIACGVTEQEVIAAKSNPDFAGIRSEALNVRDDDAVKRLIGSLDQLDFVVNSAGIIRRAAEHDPATFAEVIDVNLNGGMRVSTAARPLLAKSKGAIVFDCLHRLGDEFF